MTPSHASLLKPSPHSSTVTLTGTGKLTLTDIISVAHHDAKVVLKPPSSVKHRLKIIHQHMTRQVRQGIPIYGVTSAYGGQAGRVITNGQESKRLHTATALSDAIIHVDVSTGPPLPESVVKAAMLLRINMLLPGYSAVRLSTLNHYKKLLDLSLTPVIGSYGTVGASGDLAQNGRVLAILQHYPHTYVTNGQGKQLSAKPALTKAGLKPLTLAPKEGLGLVNGDNFSTAAAALITNDLTRLMTFNLAVASLTIQALRGSDRDFHPLLANLRPHPGQALIARMLRNLLKGSRLAHQELTGPNSRPQGTIIQDPYSIRCLPQYYGPDWEHLEAAMATVTINANSVSDNPLWTTPDHTVAKEKPYQWVSGGNFLAMHMAETIDSLRKIAIHIVKQNDRHLARLIHPQLSNGLPANLSDQAAISHCTFKGLQTQMGMYEVYASLLASPVSTAFGTHEELNQDITSHALTSAILTWEVLKLAKLAIATNLIASCQAIDLRGGPKLLSPATKHLYLWTRSHVPYIKKEQPLGHYVDQLSGLLLSDTTPLDTLLTYLKP